MSIVVPQHADDVTIEWLQSINYKIIPVYHGITIEGTYLKDLKVNLDGRGDVTELWSKPWLKSEDLIDVEHIYQSATDYNVVKCWHLHNSHTDQFAITRGKLQVTLVDIRVNSSTFGHVNTIFFGSTKPRLLKIPPMVLHGWKALSMPEVIVLNFQSEIYNPNDEWKFPWNCILENIWQPQNG